MKLLLTTIAAAVLFSSAAYAVDPFVPLTNMGGIIDVNKASMGDVIVGDYFSSGRATGRVPPKPDSVSVTTNSDGSSSTTKTYVAK